MLGMPYASIVRNQEMMRWKERILLMGKGSTRTKRMNPPLRVAPSQRA